MKDAVGQELHVGDKVAYVITQYWAGMQLKGGNPFATGRVSKINEKTISIDETSYNHAFYGSSGERRYTRKVPHRVVKIG